MVETHCYVQEDDELGSVKQLLLKKAYMTYVRKCPVQIVLASTLSLSIQTGFDVILNSICVCL